MYVYTCNGDFADSVTYVHVDIHVCMYTVCRVGLVGVATAVYCTCVCVHMYNYTVEDLIKNTSQIKTPL